MGSSQDCTVAELQVSEVGRRPTGFRGCVRIYASELCPRQDSNLRSRLRRGLLYTFLTGGNEFPHTMIGSSSGAGGLIAALVLADRVCRSGTCTLPSNTDRLSPGIGIVPDVRRRVLGGRR